MGRLAALLCGLSMAAASLAEDNAAIEAMGEYMEFAEYSDGAIFADQIASLDTRTIFFIDTRNRGQYDAGHIPGAVNIEWREILSSREEIRSDRPVVLYCETGLLSSKAQFALSVTGRDNVKVLWGGI